MCLSVAKLIKCFSGGGDVGNVWVGLLWSFSDQVAFPIAYFHLGLSFIMSSCSQGSFFLCDIFLDISGLYKLSVVFIAAR